MSGYLGTDQTQDDPNAPPSIWDQIGDYAKKLGSSYTKAYTGPLDQTGQPIYPQGGSPFSQGLIGLAAGLSRAGAPSRLPVPFGVALGMGAEGMGQGMQNAYRAGQEWQNTQGQNIQNQAAQSQLPLTLARNKMLSGLYQQLNSNPDMLQQLMTPGGMGGQSKMPSLDGINGRALGSLPTNVQPMVMNAFAKSGLPQEAFAPYVSMIQNESGGNLHVADGKAGEIGPAQVMPATGQALGYTPQQLRDPQTNLEAGAKYFAAKWMEGNGDPAKAFAGYNTGNTNGVAPGYVANGVGRLGTWGYAAPDGVIQPSDALSRSQQMMQEANRVEFAKSIGLPVTGDPATLREAAKAYLDLGLAGPKAAATTGASLSAEMTKQGWMMGPDGRMAPIPGGPNDPRQVAQTEGAKAQAEANASRTKLITTRSGVFDPVSGKEVYRQPEYHELQDPATGQEYPAFVQPGDNGQLSITGGPPNQHPGSLPPTKLGPGQEHAIIHLVDDFANEGKQHYEAANTTLLQLDQQDKNIAALNQGGGWSATGPGNAMKMQWARGINSAFQSLGVQPPFDPSKVASWEDATKLQTQLAFAQARAMGSREAAQVVNMSKAATPGAENTAAGYKAVSSGAREVANREIDLRNFQIQWMKQNGGNLTGAEEAFNNQNTPEMYGARARSTVDPVTIKSQADLSKYLPGTYAKLPNGKLTQIPMREGAPPIPSYLQGAQ